MSFKLRDYQEKALQAIETCGIQKPLVELPTGTGKTPVACELVKRRGGKALFLAHRDELLNQAVDKMLMVAPEYEERIGIVKAERDEKEADLVVASVQTLSREKRLEGFLSSVEGIKTVIVDEAHHLPSPSYVRILESLEQYGMPIVGFTATAYRADNKSPLDYFDKIIYTKSILEMISAGYLCNLRAKQIHLKELDLSAVRTRAGDYQEGDLGAALELADAPAQVVKAYLEHAAGRKAIVFCPTVALAEETRSLFVKSCVEAHMVTGEDDIEVRRETLARFARGKAEVITNCAVLLEGYDEPSVNCIIIARPTKSKGLYVQMIGRGTRRHPGKEDCLILDLVEATSRHDLMTMASLFHIKEETAEAGIQALLDSVAQAKAEGKAPPSEADMIAEAVDLLRQQSLHWIPDGPRFMLSAGEETLVLFPQDLAWGVRTIPKSREEAPRLLYTGITLEWAQGVAEDYVRNLGAMGLAKAGAKWRKDEPSDKQLEILKKYGRYRAGMTKGEASDEITRLFIKRRSY